MYNDSELQKKEKNQIRNLSYNKNKNINYELTKTNNYTQTLAKELKPKSIKNKLLDKNKILPLIN